MRTEHSSFGGPIQALRRLVIFIVFLTAAAPAYGQDVYPPLEVSNAWARMNKNDGTVSAYFDIVNHRGEDKNLTAVSSPAAERLSFNHMEWHGGGLRARLVDKIPIRAMSRTTLQPGQFFVTLHGLNVQAAPGEILPLTLTFSDGSETTIEARITNQLLGNRGRR